MLRNSRFWPHLCPYLIVQQLHRCASPNRLRTESEVPQLCEVENYVQLGRVDSLKSQIVQFLRMSTSHNSTLLHLRISRET